MNLIPLGLPHIFGRRRKSKPRPSKGGGKFAGASLLGLFALLGCSEPRPNKSPSNAPAPRSPAASSTAAVSRGQAPNPRSSAAMGAKLDRSQDPCVDFYQFACGGWLKQQPKYRERSVLSSASKGREHKTWLRLVREHTPSNNTSARAPVQRYFKRCLKRKPALAQLRRSEPFAQAQRLKGGPRQLQAFLVQLQKSGLYADARLTQATGDKAQVWVAPQRLSPFSAGPSKGLSKRAQARRKGFLSRMFKRLGVPVSAKLLADVSALANDLPRQAGTSFPSGPVATTAELANLARPFPFRTYLRALGISQKARWRGKARGWALVLGQMAKAPPQATAGLVQLMLHRKLRFALAFEDQPSSWPLLFRSHAGTPQAAFCAEAALRAFPQRGRNLLAEALLPAGQRAGFHKVARQLLAGRRAFLKEWVGLPASAPSSVDLQLQRVFLKWPSGGRPALPKPASPAPSTTPLAPLARELARRKRVASQPRSPAPVFGLSLRFSPITRKILIPPAALARIGGLASDASARWSLFGVDLAHEHLHLFDDGDLGVPPHDVDEAPPSEVRWQRWRSCLQSKLSELKDSDKRPVRAGFVLNETAADVAGMAWAWQAYREHAAKSDRTPPAAPGQFSPAQRFFLQRAQAHCSVIPLKGRAGRYLRDPHLPPPLRENFSLQQTPAFAAAFRCKGGSPMAPISRCLPPRRQGAASTPENPR